MFPLGNISDKKFEAKHIGIIFITSKGRCIRVRMDSMEEFLKNSRKTMFKMDKRESLLWAFSMSSDENIIITTR